MAPNMRRKLQKGKSSGGFVYKIRPYETVKRRAEQKGGNFETPWKNGVDLWRPKDGDNHIRFLPPTWEPHDHYGYDLWVHSWVGPNNSTFLCLEKMKSKRCPICEAANEAKKNGDEEAFNSLKTKKQVAAYMLDRTENRPTPQVWMMGWTTDRDIVASTDLGGGKALYVDNPDVGFDIKFKRTGQRIATKYFGIIVDREPTAIADTKQEKKAIMDLIESQPIPSLLHYHDADQMERAISGSVRETDEDLDQDEDRDEDQDDDIEVVARKRRRDDDDEDDRRSARSRGRRDEEDEDEDEEPRRAKSKRAQIEEDEDDDEEEENGGDEQDEEEENGDDDADAEDDDEQEDEDDDEQEEEEDEAPRPRAKSKRHSDEEDQPRRKRTVKATDEDEDDEDEADNEESEARQFVRNSRSASRGSGRDNRNRAGKVVKRRR